MHSKNNYKICGWKRIIDNRNERCCECDGKENNKPEDCRFYIPLRPPTMVYEIEETLISFLDRKDNQRINNYQYQN